MTFDEQFAAMRLALLGALSEQRGVGSGGIYMEPVLSRGWHLKHAAIIREIAVIDEHPLGREVAEILYLGD